MTSIVYVSGNWHLTNEKVTAKAICLYCGNNMSLSIHKDYFVYMRMRKSSSRLGNRRKMCAGCVKSRFGSEKLNEFILSNC